MIDVMEAGQATANDMILAKDMADALNAAYPGHLWGVNVEGEQGMAYIRLFSVSGKYGFKLRLVENYSSSDFKKRVVHGGGEILERYRLSRGPVIAEQINNLPITPAGIVIGDLST